MSLPTADWRPKTELILGNKTTRLPGAGLGFRELQPEPEQVCRIVAFWGHILGVWARILITVGVHIVLVRLRVKGLGFIGSQGLRFLLFLWASGHCVTYLAGLGAAFSRNTIVPSVGLDFLGISRV